MHRYRLAVAAAATALFTALTTGTASAAPAVLTFGGVGGAPVPIGGSLQSSGTETLYSTTTGTYGFACTNVYNGYTVTSNPVAPGSATMKLNWLQLGSCTSTVPGVTGVNTMYLVDLPYRVAVDSPGKVTYTDGGSGPMRTIIQPSVGGTTVTCAYQSHDSVVYGVWSNADNSITVTNAPFDLISSPSPYCPSPVFVSFKQAGTTGSGGLVFLN
ncbi:MAG TPA: hypothetical protein VF054_14940 [Micromonosporaceae bacterium]